MQVLVSDSVVYSHQAKAQPGQVPWTEEGITVFQCIDRGGGRVKS